MTEQYNNHEIPKEAGLKVTPQRMAVLAAVQQFKSHPSAEEIVKKIRIKHPAIATGTVYNILELFVQKGILKRVKTEKGAMLYDAIMENHHHLYCEESDRIEDYYNEELDRLLVKYFAEHSIKGFEIDDINLQLIGKFKKYK